MLAPLAGSLQGADARGALAAATAALARLLPALARPARLLAALNSVLASSVRAALPALSRAVECLSVVSLVLPKRLRLRPPRSGAAACAPGMCPCMAPAPLWASARKCEDCGRLLAKCRRSQLH